jgi:N-acyl-D-amino-acid deacylase
LELSQSSGISPEETILNLLEVNDLQVAIFNEAISEENIELLATKDFSLLASDSVGYDGNFRSKTDLPHPRSFGTFPRFLSYFVKEKGILNWEKAIYKMTGFPAEIMSISKRGVLKPENFADLVIFDPEKIEDKADYNNPYQFPEGVEYVLVNGNIVLKENALTGLKKGRILRRT